MIKNIIYLGSSIRGPKLEDLCASVDHVLAQGSSLEKFVFVMEKYFILFYLKDF
jgi:hypothetical protein